MYTIISTYLYSKRSIYNILFHMNSFIETGRLTALVNPWLNLKTTLFCFALLNWMLLLLFVFVCWDEAIPPLVGGLSLLPEKPVVAGSDFCFFPKKESTRLPRVFCFLESDPMVVVVSSLGLGVFLVSESSWWWLLLLLKLLLLLLQETEAPVVLLLDDISLSGWGNADVDVLAAVFLFKIAVHV